MKNEYVGDVNDFAKYALLKQLAGMHVPERLRLGVNWYLTPDSGREGAKTSYLDRPQPNVFLGADSVLFRQLRQLICEGRRSVFSVEADKLLPGDTVFFSEPVASIDRYVWSRRGGSALAACDLVFLDPDNGLAELGRPPAAARAALEEVVPAYRGVKV